MRFILALLTPLAFAANIPITVIGSTETQVIIRYLSTAASACTLAATDNNGGPVVADLNTSLFTNANLDLSRTVANGYRWPTISSGLQRIVVIGGHDQIKKGIDGNSYSIALQTATDHTITVTCNGGADSGTVHAQTANVPYGSYYPELPIPDPSQVTFGMQPTINWTDNTVKYLDPITGVLIQRVSSPVDIFNSGVSQMSFAAGLVQDVNGGAWTNPNYFITNQASGTLATTSTQNAPIFAPFDPGYYPAGQNAASYTFTDFGVIPYGYGSSSSVTQSTCISMDSGQTCANNTPQSTTLATSARVYSAVPSNWASSPVVPSAYFAAWGGITKWWFGPDDLANRTFTGVACSGTPTVCVVSSPSGAQGFNTTRVAGSRFALSSCGSGSPATFTVSTVDSWAQITTTAVAGGTWSACTYQDLSVGIRAVMSSTGTAHLSITGNGMMGPTAANGSNGQKWLGGLSAVTDIATDCAGATHSPPLSGYLMSLGNQGVYVIDQNGLSCLQSNLYSATYSVHGSILPDSQIPFVNSRCFVLPDTAGTPNIWKACHIANNYRAITPVVPVNNTVDNFTWTNLGPTTQAGGIQAQAIAAGGTVAVALSSGLWPNLALDTVGDNGAGSGIIQYRTQATGQDSECALVWADSNNNYLGAVALWGNYPASYAACHFGGDLAANYSLYSAQAASLQLSPIYFDPGHFVGGPFINRSSEGMYKNGSLTTWNISITACTNASPTVCSAPAGSDLDDVACSSTIGGCQLPVTTQGAWVTISGATGGWTGINGQFFAHAMTDAAGGLTFSLYSDPQGQTPVNAASFGSFSGTVTASMLPPLYSVQIGSVVNNSGHARIVPSATPGYAHYFPSGALVVQDGDPIAINATTLTSTTQYYAKVSGAPSGDFDVYSDAALTSPVTYSTLSGAAGSYAVLAQTCPDPATVTLPGPLYMDTGFGTTGAGNQKVRCVTIRLHDEACSDYPATGEHGTYPCSSDPSNPSRSMLHQINVGDGFGDLSHFGGEHEILFVLAVNRISTNQIDVTLLRSYGDAANYGGRGYSQGTNNSYSLQHAPGWTPWSEATVVGGLIGVGSSPAFAIPPVNGAHNDFVPGATSGSLSQISGYQGTQTGTGVIDSKVNQTVSTFTGPASYLHQSFPYWASLLTTSSLFQVGGEDGQSYPSMRTISGQAPASEFGPGYSWNLDWMAQNGANGEPQNNGDGVGLTRTLTNIQGTTYDSGSTTSIVFLVPTMQSGPTNIKIAPIFLNNWPSGYFTDISGPATVASPITDAQQGSYCVAYTAGECRPNSTAGQVFASMRGYSDSFGQCIANNSTVGYPCAFGLWPGGGWAVQVRNVPVDTQNLGVRRLTLAWTPPLNHYDFSNWITTPDAKWGLFTSNPIQQRANFKQYQGSHWFAMKLPPSPPTDAVNRATYVPYPLTFPAGISGDKIRVAFGYAENGNPASFYCTARAEACYTSAAPTTTNPFAFAGESPSYTPCSSGCTVSIPAIPGRILYYQLQRVNGSTITPGAMSVVAQN